MNVRSKAISDLKLYCDELTKDFNTRFKPSSNPQIHNHILEFKLAINTFIKKDEKNLIKDAASFIESINTIANKSDHQELNQFIRKVAENVQSFKKEREKEQKQQEILEIYLGMYAEFESSTTAQLEQDFSILDQIELLSKINKYILIMDSHAVNKDLDDEGKKIIKDKSKVFQAYFEALKKTIEQTGHDLAQEITTSMGGLNAIVKKAHTSYKKGYLKVAELKNTTDEYKKFSTQLKNNIDLISKINLKDYQPLLSISFQEKIKNHLSIQNELTDLIKNAEGVILVKYKAMDSRIKEDLKQNLRVNTQIGLLNYLRECQALFAGLNPPKNVLNLEMINEIYDNFNTYEKQLKIGIENKLAKLVNQLTNNDRLKSIKLAVQQIHFDHVTAKNNVELEKLIQLTSNYDHIVNQLEIDFNLVSEIEKLKHIKLSEASEKHVVHLLNFKNNNNTSDLTKDVKLVFVEKYQAIEKHVSNELEKTLILNTQFELLNYIQVCQSALQLAREKWTLAKPSSSQKTDSLFIGFINTIIDTDLNKTINETIDRLKFAEKSLQSKMETLICDITKDIWNLDHLYKEKSRPEIHLLAKNPEERVAESTELQNSYNQNFKEISGRVDSYAKLILQIKSIHKETLSETAKKYVDKLLSFEAEINEVNKKRDDIITDHLNIQVKTNELLSSLQEEIKTYEGQRQRMVEEYNDANRIDNERGAGLLVGKEQVTSDDSELSLKEKFYSSVYIKNHIKHSFLFPLDKLDEQFLQIKNKANLDSFRYKDGRAPVFSKELKDELQSIRNKIDINRTSCDLEHQRLNQRMLNNERESARIKIELETREASFLQHKFFKKVDGHLFKEIQQWIFKNEHYTKLINYQNETKNEAKSKKIKDFQYGIERAKNLAELVDFLSPNYKYSQKGSFQFKNEAKTDIDISVLHADLRRNSHFINLYSIFSDYASTTDEYLSILGKAFIEHLEKTYMNEFKQSHSQYHGKYSENPPEPLTNLLPDLKMI